MTSEISDDLLGGSAPKRAKRRRESRGPLHDLLTRALPDFRHPEYGVCDLHRLADALGISPQAVYKWMRAGHLNRISPTQVERIVALSAEQTTGGKRFKPVDRAAFWDFLVR